MTSAIASPLVGFATPVAVTETTSELLLKDVMLALSAGAAQTTLVRTAKHAAYAWRRILQAVQVNNYPVLVTADCSAADTLNG